MRDHLLTGIFQITLPHIKTASQLSNRVIDPDQIGNHVRPMAVYGDETNYPGTIYPWLEAPRLLNGLANPDALLHTGFRGGGALGSANLDSR